MQSENNQQLSELIINKSYVLQACQSLNSRQNLITTLLSQRSLPEQGWDDLQIEMFLQQLAAMDTNNFANKVGVGEREGRVYSQIVEKRNFFMSHGIGRSGDVSADQPKAAGSSLMLKLTQFLAKDALKQMGIQFINGILVLPLATGMALSLSLLTFKQMKPKSQYVIWPRIDQKTCLKCILTANLIPISIDGIIKGDSICSDLETIEQKIQELNPENILCVLSTTSCFAPRVFDNVEEIAKICKKYNIFHLINNAYGLQCSKIVNAINQACKQGTVDAVVQSTDKNFMVPVGGTIIFSPSEKVIQKISEQYPGRATSSPIMDLFITLLSMGKSGLKQLLIDRKQNLIYLKEKLNQIAEQYNERVLDTPQNSISVGMTLNRFKDFIEEEGKEKDLNQTTSVGSILYSKRVMGSRIITKKPGKQLCGISFNNYGSSHQNYHSLPYMTIACAIGMKKEEIDCFIKKLIESFKELDKKLNKSTQQIKLKQEQLQQQILVIAVKEEEKVKTNQEQDEQQFDSQENQNFQGQTQQQIQIQQQIHSQQDKTQQSENEFTK